MRPPRGHGSRRWWSGLGLQRLRFALLFWKHGALPLFPPPISQKFPVICHIPPPQSFNAINRLEIGFFLFLLYLFFVVFFLFDDAVLRRPRRSALDVVYEIESLESGGCFNPITLAKFARRECCLFRSLGDGKEKEGKRGEGGGQNEEVK